MTVKVSGADLTTFNALSNLEQQIAFLSGLLLTAQNTYNAANPTSAKAAVAISPSYTNRVMTVQCQFPIESDSVLQALHENVTEVIPAA